MKNQSRSNLQALAITFLILFVGISGCKKSGGGVTDPGEPPVTEPEITSSFEDEEAVFLPGEIRLIRLEEITLDAEEYKAQLGNGFELFLYANPNDDQNKSLLFTVPEEAKGDHKLLFSLKGQDQSLDFKIKEYEVIADPGQYTNSFIEDLTTEFQQLIDETEEGPFKERLVATMDTLEMKKAEISSLFEQELKLLARIISSHFKTNSSSSKLKFASGNARSAQLTCPENLPEKALSSAAGAGISLYAFSLSGTIASTGWGVLVGGITATISGTTLYVSMKSLKSSLTLLWECKIEYFDRALSALSEKNPLKQKSETLAFEHGTGRSFYVVSEFEMPKDIQAALNKVKSYTDKIIELIPEPWIEVIYREYVTTEEDSPNGFIIRNISDDRISGTTKAKDDQILINFTYEKERILDGENTPFTFDLVKEEYNQSIAVEATLKPLIPIAHDKQVTIERDSTSVSDTLEADYAADFIIESSPSNGTVTLDNVFTGEFTYQTDEGYTGDDSFTFSASNSSGKSEISTINIKITEDSLTIYQNAVLGDWLVYGIDDGVQSSEPGNLVLYEDGSGRYVIEGPDGANKDGIDENGNSYYNISWSIKYRNERYYLSESGFWHYGYESYRSYDEDLSEAALTLPITFFYTYNDFGDGPSLSRKYVKN